MKKLFLIFGYLLIAALATAGTIQFKRSINAAAPVLQRGEPAVRESATPSAYVGYSTAAGKKNAEFALKGASFTNMSGGAALGRTALQTASQIVAALQTAFPGLTYTVSGPSASGAGLVPDAATQSAITALTTAGASTVLWRDTTGIAGSGSATITGQGATGAVGSMTAAGTASTTVTLIGQGSTGAVGTLTITANGNVTVSLTGQGATGAVGSLTAYAGSTVALTGQGATGSVGTLTASSATDVTVAPTGQGATGGVGTLTASALPATPTQSALTVGDTQLTANWGSVSGATSYNVYYSTSASLTGTTYDGTNAYPGTANATSGKITGISSGAVSQVITGLTDGTTYYVKVSAVNASGESALSSGQSASPSAPALIHQYLFSEASGTAVADSGTATAINGTDDVSTNIVAGYSGNGRKYYDTLSGGSNTKLRFSSPVIPVGPKTITFRIKPSAVTDGMNICFTATSTTAVGISIGAISGGAARVTGLKGTAGVANFQITTANTMANNSWNFVEVSWDGTTGANAVKIRLNGGTIATGTALVPDATPTGNLAVGWESFEDPGLQTNSNAVIDEINIYNYTTF